MAMKRAYCRLPTRQQIHSQTPLKPPDPKSTFYFRGLTLVVHGLTLVVQEIPADIQEEIRSGIFGQQYTSNSRYCFHDR